MDILLIWLLEFLSWSSTVINIVFYCLPFTLYLWISTRYIKWNRLSLVFYTDFSFLFPSSSFIQNHEYFIKSSCPLFPSLLTFFYNFRMINCILLFIFCCFYLSCCCFTSFFIITARTNSFSMMFEVYFSAFNTFIVFSCPFSVL